MAHAKGKRNEVRKRYVFDGMGLATCATAAGISYATAQRWKKDARENGDDWDRVKAAHTMAGSDLEDIGRQILTDFVVQFKASMDLIHDENLPATKRVQLLTSLSDSYNKAIAANKKIMPKTSKLAVAFEVIEKFKDYVMQHAPDVAPKFAELLLPFGEQMEKELK